MIKVYSRKTCAPCRTLKYWLDSKKIDYELFDLDEKPELAQKLNIFTVPTVFVNEEIIRGLNLSRLSELLS